MCEGHTGHVCEYTCDDDYVAYGDHVCQPSGEFSGGSCRPADLCLDDPAWVDADGKRCSEYGGATCPTDAMGLDTRLVAEACPVSCNTCSCRDEIDQDPGPGGVSCEAIKSQGLCDADASMTGAADLTGAPLWTFCCASCRGCDGVANSDAVDDNCGVCGGDDSSCAGCDGIANSGAEEVACGVCGGTGGSCMFDTVCTPTAGGLTPVSLWLAAEGGGEKEACLTEDAAVSIGLARDERSFPESNDPDNISPTIEVKNSWRLTIDCTRVEALCAVIDRIGPGHPGVVKRH
jgi:hypothetical protein